jgi:hypothetical protein
MRFDTKNNKKYTPLIIVYMAFILIRKEEPVE